MNKLLRTSITGAYIGMKKLLLKILYGERFTVLSLLFFKPSHKISEKTACTRDDLLKLLR